MVKTNPFHESLGSKEKLFADFKSFAERKLELGQNALLAHYGFCHGEAIMKYCDGKVESLMKHADIPTTSIAYFQAGLKAWNNLYNGLTVLPLSKNTLTAYSRTVPPAPLKAPRILPYLTALRTKPFMLLAGISGTGKSRIVREMAFKTCPKYLQDKDGTTPGNYCMIEVKPNWHDSTELIGYYSNLSHSYQFKKFVKFLVKAQMNPEVPFFVCLDEMNLAPVEQYFAEILSILETRKHPKKDGVANMEIIKTEVIVESRYFTPSWKDKDNAVHEKIMSDADWYREFFDIEKGSREETEVPRSLHAEN